MSKMINEETSVTKTGHSDKKKKEKREQAKKALAKSGLANRDYQ